ncbi:MAG: hypothetical protein HFI87_01820 [Bacilli bacterium]|nr:hypothetical protein [Bacilli bacterium]
MFIMKKDLSKFFKKNYKIILFILSVITIFCIYAKKNYSDVKELFMITLGLTVYPNSFPIDYIIFVFHIGINLYITLYIFYSLFKNDIETIFLRLPITTWFLYKEISIMIILFIIKLVLYFITSLISQYKSIGNIIKFLLIDNLLTFNIGLLALLLLMLLYKNKILSIISLIIIIAIITIFKIPLIVSGCMNLWIYFIFIYILIFLLLTKLIKNQYITLFERSIKKCE